MLATPTIPCPNPKTQNVPLRLLPTFTNPLVNVPIKRVLNANNVC